jgi:hypothetical protein
MIAKLVSIVMMAAALTTARTATQSQTQTLPGTYALQTGEDKTIAELVAHAVPNDPLVRKLDITLGDDTGTLRRYDLDMTKYLHLIIVSDDFRWFAHVHPRLHSNGHFTLVQRFPGPGTYHIYADCDPTGIGQQVFRFDLALGATTSAARELVPTGNVATAGPYRVTLSSTTIDGGSESHLRVRITRNGKPARDLHPYLGALAHAVFLNSGDLTYVHVHPLPIGDAMPGMDMSSGNMEMPMPTLSDREPSSPDMELHVAVRERGTYELWFQFRGAHALHVAAFVITAR